MINGHGKTDSSMFTKFAVGFIYKNFTHSHITVLRFYYMYAVMNCLQKHEHQYDLTIYHRILFIYNAYYNHNYNVGMYIVQGEE